VKHFVIYTVLRLALFLATFAVLSTLTVLIFGGSTATWFVTLLLAAVVSSVLSLRVLAGPRERFAASVEARAQRASAKLDQIRSREDAD
jgi:hypothetical protein